jgi:hypothetical protein
MKTLFSLVALCLFTGYIVGYSKDYTISNTAPPLFANQDAFNYTIELMESYPEIQRRMLDPTHRPPRTDWAYYSQTYSSESTMLHLIALQIKAMAEHNAIQSTEDILDPKFGLGSKNHKDKGTLKNPLSFFGHPVQKEVLATKSTLRTLKVYHAFRRTIKNDLIRFARNQSLEWHQQHIDQRVKATLEFLYTEHPRRTLELRKKLRAFQLDLEILLRKALSSHLLS